MTSQDAFFDVRVFHPSASSYHSQALYDRHESAKKREERVYVYNQRVHEMEGGVFILVWYFPQVEEWVGKPEFSTKNSQM